MCAILAGLLLFCGDPILAAAALVVFALVQYASNL